MADESKSKALEGLDLERITIADLTKLKNPAIRDALVDMINGPSPLASSHQNHGSHGDHTTDSSRFLELEMLANRGRLGPTLGRGE